MDYESLKALLVDPNSNIWVNGKKIAEIVPGAALWEYGFGGLGLPRVVVRGVETNNPQQNMQEAYVSVDGKKLELKPEQFLDLFHQMGYLYSVVQPQRLKEQNRGK
ncbi:MAG: hypothetical protein E7006_03790 [Alphaproteobacteria bacterium]|nr:hypothetical protein [Alphaproteobacteria bacterium]